MKYYAIGIDLAKNVFQVCGVNRRLKSLFNKKIKRKEFFSVYGDSGTDKCLYGVLLFFALLGQKTD